MSMLGYDEENRSSLPLLSCTYEYQFFTVIQVFSKRTGELNPPPRRSRSTVFVWTTDVPEPVAVLELAAELAAEPVPVDEVVPVDGLVVALASQAE